MRFSEAIDQFTKEMFAEGRFNSDRTERGYRNTLRLHADDIGNRDPSKVGRDDVKRTLQRWTHPNTRSLARSHLVSFYDWTLESGIRKDNPARQTRRPKTRKPQVYRLTRDEVRSFRAAARGDRERCIADFGLLAGLRAKELTGLQGRHLRRPGWVWVSADIAKGGRERWVPVLPELEPAFTAAALRTADSGFVLPNRQQGIYDFSRRDVFDASQPMSYQALLGTVGRIGKRAGIAAPVKPHMMRHAFGDHIAKFAGIKVAQFVLGHVSVSTTERYTGAPSLDEVAATLAEFGYGQGQLPAEDSPVSAVVAAAERLGLKTAGSEPVWGPGPSGWLLARVMWDLGRRPGFREAAKAVSSDV